MVDTARLELASSGCKPEALPLSYMPGARPQNRTELTRFAGVRLTIWLVVRCSREDSNPSQPGS